MGGKKRLDLRLSVFRRMVSGDANGIAGVWALEKKKNVQIKVRATLEFREYVRQKALLESV